MQSSTFEILITASLVFAVFKYSLHFIGWYSKDDTLEQSARTILDTLFDKLEQNTIKQLIVKSLRRLYLKLEGKLNGYSSIIKLYMQSSLIVFTLIFLLVANPIEFNIETGDIGFVDILANQYLGETLITSLLLGLSGAFTIIFSAVITYFLIKKASQTNSLWLIFVHLLLDLIFIYIIFAFTIYIVFYGQHITSPGGLGTDLVSQSFVNIIDEMLQAWMFIGDFEYFLSFNVITVIQSLPTFLYTMLILLALIGHLTPDTVKNIINKIIYRISSDSSDVFKTIGNGIGGVGAVISVIVKII